jgi:hypothetical protein
MFLVFFNEAHTQSKCLHSHNDSAVLIHYIQASVLLQWKPQRIKEQIQKVLLRKNPTLYPQQLFDTQ